MIFPALTSMRICKKFKTVIICSAAVAEVCFVAGTIVSYESGTPGGSSIVIANLIAFFVFWGIGALKGRVKA